MSYGYDSSTPTLTLNLTPEQRQAGRELARLLHFTQSRGATAGQGSLSQLVQAIAQHAQDTTPRNTATRLAWTRRVTPDPAWRSPTPVMVDADLVPKLMAVAKYAGHVRRTGPSDRHGEGSANALIAAITQHAHEYGADATARKMKWLAN